MKKTLALAALLVGLDVTAAAAQEDAFLARLVGDWIGRGAMRTSPQAEPERVFCKIANTLIADGRTLQQKGRCSLASNSGAIDGTIAAMGSNLYGGTLNSLASRGPTTIAGSASANRLELNAEFVDSFDGEPARAMIVIDLVAGGGYRLTSTRVDPDDGSTWTASEIVFSE
ncbi:MAG: hypothetical protein WD099_04750 [Dongiaceae bacterium]